MNGTPRSGHKFGLDEKVMLVALTDSGMTVGIRQREQTDSGCDSLGLLNSSRSVQFKSPPSQDATMMNYPSVAVDRRDSALIQPL